jgi:3-phenylpropionate/trans-cinnamate dioxygenase ferredoxin reductase component
MSQRTFVIVGASLAGAKGAEELRERGFDGRVVLIGAEPERPYERPPLTKDYLRAEAERDKAYVHPEAWYAAHEVDLLTEVTVRDLDARSSRVMLDDGSEVSYDALLLATGAEPRRLSVPGAELEGISYLRTLADCDALRSRLEPGARVTVVGAGWIGSEFAASARQLDLEVSVIDPLALPNERIFGEQIGAFYRDVHVAHGVEMLLGRGVEAFEGEGTVGRVRLTDGTSVDCDFAVIGVGAQPRTALAVRAGLNVDNGIVVDERLVTSVPNIFAAGDVASAWHPFYERRIRVEHWANALNQGPAAARSMLGHDASYERIPYFFSDQYEVGMEYSGYAERWDEVVFRGNPDDGDGFVAFWLHSGQVLAGMNVNVWDVNQHVRELIRARCPVDARVLADLETPLDGLVGELTA